MGKMKKNPIEKYALQATSRSYSEIIEVIDNTYGAGSAAKNPGLVSTLLRFQEEMIRSTTELIVSGKISIELLSEFVEAK